MWDPCRSVPGGGQALTSPSRHSLGRPLPYQQADSPQALPKAINLYRAHNFTIPEELQSYVLGLLGITPPFGELCPTSG